MYDKAVRDKAQMLLLAGHAQAEVRRMIAEEFGVDVSRQTLSDWAARVTIDDDLRARAEQYRKDNDDRTWNNIGMAQEILRRKLTETLDDTEKISEAVGILCDLTEHGMFDEATTAKAAGVIDMLNEIKNAVGVRDALAVVKDLCAQSARSDALAAGTVSGTFQLTFDDELEELSG